MAPKSKSRHGVAFDQGCILVMLDGPQSVLHPLWQEAGGHRWQRIPPTERRGRVQTSTVTVAVLDVAAAECAALRESDVLVRVTKGTGPGGQNRNKRETAVVLRHIPTGIEVKAEVERTQEANRRVAMATLRERVDFLQKKSAQAMANQTRKAAVGTGQRGDKIRTYREDGVTDHRTGKKAALRQVLEGRLGLLI